MTATRTRPDNWLIAWVVTAVVVVIALAVTIIVTTSGSHATNQSHPPVNLGNGSVCTHHGADAGEPAGWTCTFPNGGNS